MTLTTPTRQRPTTDRPEATSAQPTATPRSPRRGRATAGRVAAGLVVLATGALGAAAIVAMRDDSPARDDTTPPRFEHPDVPALDRVTSRVEVHDQVANSGSHSEVVELSPTAVESALISTR
jgi:hypothetical protein